MPWLYPVEINSLAMRTKGAAVATASNWISNYCVVQATPPGIENLGWKFYLIWMSFNIIFVPVRLSLPLPVHPRLTQPPQLIWLVYPETSNRHLEDIDRLYRENQGMVFVFRNKDATSMQRPTHYVDVEKERMQYVDSTKKKDKLADEASIEHDEAPAALNAA